MKKLNITKKQYDESKYFNKKYGALKFVSESGKLYKTDKGVVLALESIEDIKGDDDDEGKKEDDAPTGDDADKGAEGGDSTEVTRGELTEMLKDVVADIETVCDKQDLSFEEVAGIEKPEGESDEEADKDEVIATKEEVAEVLAGVIEKVTDIAEKNSVELPLEIEKKDDDDGDVTVDGDDEKSDLDKARDGELEIDEGKEEKVCPTCGAKMSVKKEGCADGECKNECGGAACECGDKEKMMESRKARARLVREAVIRRAKARKVRESIERRRRVRKVMESIRRRRAAKKVLESIRKRHEANKVMESTRKSNIKKLNSTKKVMEARRARALRAGLKK